MKVNPVFNKRLVFLWLAGAFLLAMTPRTIVTFADVCDNITKPGVRIDCETHNWNPCPWLNAVCQVEACEECTFGTVDIAMVCHWRPYACRDPQSVPEAVVQCQEGMGPCPGAVASQPGVAPIEFTVHSTRLDRDADGFVYLTIVKWEALRSDGSYSVYQMNIDHQDHHKTLTHGTVWDKRTGRKTVVSPNVGAKMSTRFDVEEFFAPMKGGCTPAILDAPEVAEFLRYRVVETVDEVTGGGLIITRRRGYAPDLNCLPLYRTSRISDLEGSLRATNLYRVNSILLGEPPSKFFVIPEGYAEMSPLEVTRAEFKYLGYPEAVIEHVLSTERMLEAEIDYTRNRWE